MLADLAGFLYSAQAEELSCAIRSPPPYCAIAPLFSRSRKNYFILFISVLGVTCINKII
jgi:hypothetical protein